MLIREFLKHKNPLADYLYCVVKMSEALTVISIRQMKIKIKKRVDLFSQVPQILFINSR